MCRFVVAVMAVVIAGCTGGGKPLVESTTRTAPRRDVVVRTRNGVTVHFTVSRSSPMLTAFRTRYAVVVADDKRFGHPPLPEFCRPYESFEGTVTLGKAQYNMSGAVDSGSFNRMRIMQYGSGEGFVLVLAKAFVPVREPLTVHLRRPVFNGPMTLLGDGWFVVAARVPTPAPWYVEGMIQEDGASASTPIATIPETRAGRC
jgi:hypothetical protein